MRPQVLFPALVLILAMLACNFPVATPPVTETPTLFLITPSATLALPTIAPTFTPAPTNTAPPPPTSTVPIASPNGVNVNCRLGPGTSWVPLERASRRTNSSDHGPFRRWDVVAGQRSAQSGQRLLGSCQRSDHRRQPVRDWRGSESDCHCDQCDSRYGSKSHQCGRLYRTHSTDQDQRDHRDERTNRGEMAVRDPARRCHAHTDHNVRYFWRNGFLCGLHANGRGRDLLGSIGGPQPEQYTGRRKLSYRLPVVVMCISFKEMGGLSLAAHLLHYCLLSLRRSATMRAPTAKSAPTTPTIVSIILLSGTVGTS